VTGGIGAGKTAVLHLFAELGAATMDADDVVHSLYDVGQPGYLAVVDRWGDRILTTTGTVDRAAIAEIVFADKNELFWINGVIHPMVQERIGILARESMGALYCGVPLLFEAGWERSMWKTIAVWCDSSTQADRLRQRGWSSQEIQRRLACQMSMDEKLRRADYGIVNCGSWEHLREQCQLLRNQLETETNA
jgi:dephospho-CoA kinase